MNVFLYELKMLWKSTLIWSVTLAALASMFFGFYPVFAANLQSAVAIFEGFPPALREALGIYMDSFFTLNGFYSFIFTYVALCGSIQAMYLGLGILSKETRMKTADFLLTKPVKRSTIVSAKLGASVISLAITNVIYTAAISFAATLIDEPNFSMEVFLLMTLTLGFIQLIFMSIGLCFAAFAKKVKSVLSITLSTVFAFFAIGMLGSVIGDDKAQYLSPFKFLDLNYIISNTAYDAKFVVIGFLWIGIAIGLTYWYYVRKEVHSV